jgi:hypothetical protein
MEELIWFSMPGAVFVAAVVALWPEAVDTDPKAILLVILVPLAGFVLHQLYRLLFEWTGGYARKSRSVIHYIKDKLAPQKGVELEELREAFMVWELTFYGDEFPAAFRSHDRRAWHYILSFWSIALSGIIASLLGALWCCFKSCSALHLGVALSGLAVAALFYLKGGSTYDSLVEQEEELAMSRADLFYPALEKLGRREKDETT